MLSGLEYVKETIEIRREDLVGNAFNTNELLMDDIIIALGYNKKRDIGVKALYEENADWEIGINNENRMLIKVYGFEDKQPDINQLSDAFKLADESNYKYVLVTNGQSLFVYENGAEIVGVADIFDDSSDDILMMLSKNGWNTSEIDKLKIDTSIDIQNILNRITDNTVKIANLLLTQPEAEIIVDEQLNKLSYKIGELVNRPENADSVEIKELISKLEVRDTRIEELEKQIEANNTVNKNNETDGIKDESSYRNKISILIEEKQKILLELSDVKQQLNELIIKQSGAEDEKVVMAKQLLEAVEDNTELNRAYVGVVNSRLFQISELPRFVGTCLQELYLSVNFELMHYLFDGDIFKMVQPAKRVDLMINTKQYDIDITGMTEQEVLSRLKTLFSKFDKMIFMCKTIGTLRNQEEYTEENNDDSYESIEENFASSSMDETDFNGEHDSNSVSDEYIEEEPMSYSEEDIDGQGFENELVFSNEGSETEVDKEFTEIDLTKVEQDFESELEFNGQIQSENIDSSNEEETFEEPEILISETFEEPEIDVENNYLSLALCDIGQILWSDNNPIISLEAIGNSENVFKIDSSSQNKMINTSIEALLSMCDNSYKSLVELKNNMDLQSISALIHTGKQNESDIKILDTEFFVSAADNSKCISMILAIADALGLESTETYMYFKSGESITVELTTNYVSIDSLCLQSRIKDMIIEECTDTIHCIISGSVMSEVVRLGKTEYVLNKLVKNTVAVRTQYMTNSIRSIADIAKTTMNCLNQLNKDDINTVVTEINTEMGLSKNVIEADANKVTDDAVKYAVGDSTFYVDELSASETTMMILKLHNLVTKDNVVDIRVELDSSVYKTYMERIITADPEEYLIAKCILSVIEGRTKTLSK